ncbi:hypothetical protein P154DRAFT_519054 [Amniculicola lignicola CBS 123094]|uniref:FCP1 homology domain-containing protein n=1 Tax=Amniculicola lignicola CBS 123094 TaxID=1392246 RepID=A0A6A5WT38_9PLEO|nr:hypothetical protein P154DRAFT_519054 [Amniculicola lignicola CBS 123094]
MNSLNLISNFGTPPPSPPRSRAGSESNILQPHHRAGYTQQSDDAGGDPLDGSDEQSTMRVARPGRSADQNAEVDASEFDEKTPLLSHAKPEPFPETRVSKAWLIPKQISGAVIGTVKVLLTAVFAPGRYVIALFYDDHGKFSALSPVYKISRPFTRSRRKGAVVPSGADSGEKEKRRARRASEVQGKGKKLVKRAPSIASTSAITSDSDLDSERPPTRDERQDAPSRHTRSKSTMPSATEEIAPAKRSIKIKLHNEEALRHRKARKASSQASKGGAGQVSMEAANALKSPTGPVGASSKLTKFPRAPQPPRPLVPRRQPSYSTSGTSAVGPHQKTLILDLDETLIHSMAKGGHFTTGHMVEVKLQQPVGAGAQVIGPQVPILYYVHKRPYCDEFLKKASKWYNLVVFTASVQEYADPVIDWLEVERKYFAGRYYRQHCTFRNGAYIKDLAQVEPDLSKVMIVDNSPLSYVFNEDNAIPITSWISDPTDNDLLHLIPLLEGLQYVTDVRALLALRLGQPQSA